MDNRRQEITLGQAVNLANAACLQSDAYSKAPSLDAKKEIIHKAIDFYFEVINEAFERNVGSKPQNNYSNNYKKSYNNTYTNNEFKPSANPKPASLKQVNWIKKIITNNQSIPLEEVESMQQKIDANTLNNNDVNEFVGQYK